MTFADNMRADGRTREDYRHMELETDVVSNAAGSARLCLANSDVLVGIKVEISEPSVKRPNEGRLEFFVDCSANAAPEFEGRGGDELALSVSSMLTRAYSDAGCLDLSALCVLPRLKCWVLYVDILILKCGGNLFDVVSLAVKAALYNTRIPILTVVSSEQGIPEIEVSDDPYNCKRIGVAGVPCLVTLSKVDNCHIVDASIEEEKCAMARLIIGVSETGTVTTIRKEGGGSLHPDSISEMIDSGQRVGQMLNKSLMLALVKEEKEGKTQKLTGFLR